MLAGLWDVWMFGYLDILMNTKNPNMLVSQLPQEVEIFMQLSSARPARLSTNFVATEMASIDVLFPLILVGGLVAMFYFPIYWE